MPPVLCLWYEPTCTTPAEGKSVVLPRCPARQQNEQRRTVPQGQHDMRPSETAFRHPAEGAQPEERQGGYRGGDRPRPVCQEIHSGPFPRGCQGTGVHWPRVRPGGDKHIHACQGAVPHEDRRGGDARTGPAAPHHGHLSRTSLATGRQHRYGVRHTAQTMNRHTTPSTSAFLSTCTDRQTIRKDRRRGTIPPVLLFHLQCWY